MTMPLELSVRTMRAIAAFDPEATTSDLRRVLAELRDALDQLEAVVHD